MNKSRHANVQSKNEMIAENRTQLRPREVNVSNGLQL